MVHSWAIIVAEHVLLRRWLVGVDVGRVDEIPFLILFEVVDFWGPITEGIRGVLRRLDHELDFSGIPVGKGTASKEGNIVLSSVGHVITIAGEN